MVEPQCALDNTKVYVPKSLSVGEEMVVYIFTLVLLYCVNSPSLYNVQVKGCDPLDTLHKRMITAIFSSDPILTFCPHVNVMEFGSTCAGFNGSCICGSPTYIMYTFIY